MPEAVRVAAPDLNPKAIALFVEEPLKQLPADWRPLVWDFWAFFSDLMPTQLALCTRIRWWRDNDGLTRDELVRAFGELRKAGKAGAFQFTGQLLGAIGTTVEVIRKADRDAERKARDKAKASQPFVLPSPVMKLAGTFRPK